MSETKHIPGPLRVFDGGGQIGNRGTLAIVGGPNPRPKNEVVARAGFDQCSYPKKARATARRLVACYNAMEGVEDPATAAHKIAAFDRLEPLLKEWLEAEIAWRDEPGAEPSTEVHIRRGQAHNNLRKALIKEPPHGE